MDLSQAKKEGVLLLALAKKIMTERAAKGRGCSAENPWLSAAWKQLEELLKDKLWKQVRLDQRTLNLRSAAGGLHLKPTRIISTSDDVVTALDLRCSADHVHYICQGKAITKRSETYSQKMAELVAKAVMKRVRAARKSGQEEHGGGASGQHEEVGRLAGGSGGGARGPGAGARCL